MNTPTKTDQKAAERLLTKAVQAAIADLHAATIAENPVWSKVTRWNAERFQLACRAAELFLTPPQEGT